MNGVYGTMVGSSVLRDFINNGLSQANFKVESFQRPSGLIDGGPCANNANVTPSASASASPSASSRNVGSEKELYLPGTQCVAATPSASASSTPSTLPSIVPSLPTCATPTPTPTPGQTPTPTPTPSGVTPTPTPTPSCLPLPGVGLPGG
jgi:hypothetical protein